MGIASTAPTAGLRAGGREPSGAARGHAWGWSRRPALLAAAAAVLLAACGGAASSPATTGGADAVLGAPHAAQGEPIVLAMVNEDTGTLGTFPQYRQSAQAVVDYLNAYRNGIHGRPIKLATCASDGTPPTSAACANRLLDQHPVAVAAGFDLGSDGSVPVFAKAGLAYIGTDPISASDQTNPNSIQFSAGSASAFGAQAAYIADVLHATKVSIIYPNFALGTFVLRAIMIPDLNAHGISTSNIKTVAQDPSATDWTASMAAATSSSPDAIMTVSSATSCVSMMQAHHTLGSTAKLFTTGSCGGESLLKAAGPAAEGTMMNSSLLLTDPSPDVALYKAIMKKFGPASVTIDATAQNGATTVMNIWRVFNQIPVDQLTTENILRAFHTGVNQPNFMDHPYTCDGQQAKIAPAACSAYARIVVVKSGKLTYVDNNWYKA